MDSAPQISTEDAADAFVASIMGRQSPPDSRQKKRPGRARKSLKVASLTIASRSLQNSDHYKKSLEDIAKYENGQMGKEEVEQRAVDNFWGVDKESSECRLSRLLMTKEDDRSRSQEMYYKAIETQKQWEEDEKMERYREAYNTGIKEGYARKQYMKTFYTTNTTVDILYFEWPTNAHLSTQLSSNTMYDRELQREEEFQQLLDSILPTSNDSLVSSITRVDLQDSLEGGQSTVHIGSLQKSIVISDDKIHSYVTTQAAETSYINNRQHSSQAAMRPIKLMNNNKKLKAVRKRNLALTTTTSGSFSRSLGSLNYQSPYSQNVQNKSATQANSFATATAAASQEGPETSYLSHRNSAGFNNNVDQSFKDVVKDSLLYGHPTFKWDQIQVIEHVFNNLDKFNAGVLTVEQLAHMSENEGLLDLLEYTVFYPWIKLGQWDKFESLGGLKGTLSLEEWLEVAAIISSETRVPPSRIRTEEQHLYEGSLMSLSLEERIASQTRNCVSNASRATALRRILGQGDVVWGMIGGCGRWLPAVIDSVCSDGTYGLTYPLTPKDLQNKRMAVETRQLIPLPAHISTDNGPIPMKRLADEMLVCDYFFTLLIQEDAVVTSLPNNGNKVSVDTLRNVLLHGILENGPNKNGNHKFQTIIESSLCLSLLVNGSIPFRLPHDSPSYALLEMLCETMSVSVNVSNSSDVFVEVIEKEVFIDYCMTLQDFYEMNYRC